MADQHSPLPPAPDEIDLVRVFVRTVNFFKTNGTIFLLACFLAAGASAGYLFLKKPVYESRFTAECMSLPDGRTVELLNDLEKLRENEDWELLGRKLGMLPADVALIRKFEPLSNVAMEREAKKVDDYLLPTTEVAYKFSLIVKVKDNRILPLLQKGVIKYLSENEYSTVRVNRFIENRKALLQAIDEELKKLDSLNLLFADRLVRGSQGTTLVGPGDFKAMVIQLKEKRLSVEDELRFAQPVRVIQGFVPFKNPVEPVRLLVILEFFALFNVLALFFIVIRNLRSVYVQNQSR